jgi:cysteinyl-tRNA synthetase
LGLLQERTAARERRDWSEADRLRRQLETLGWRVQDTPQGPQLEALG